jgi:MFS family permease
MTDAVFLMITYALLNLSNIAFNSLYPIYASAPRPTGRAMSPKEIGLMLSLSGGVGIMFQAFLFSPIQSKLGNVWSYRSSFVGFVVAFFAMPLVGISESASKGWMWAELSAALLVKSVSVVAGLTCAMLLITNASPKPNTLGVLNGMAQTLSAGGRAIGPFVSGALFTAGFKMDGGEWLSWGLFGGIALAGLGLSFALRWPRFDSDEAEPLLGDESPERGNWRGRQ